MITKIELSGRLSRDPTFLVENASPTFRRYHRCNERLANYVRLTVRRHDIRNPFGAPHVWITWLNLVYGPLRKMNDSMRVDLAKIVGQKPGFLRGNRGTRFVLRSAVRPPRFLERANDLARRRRETETTRRTETDRE